MHTVAILAAHGVIPFDLSIPCEVFGRVRLPNADDQYDVRVCGEAAEVRTRGFGIRAPWTLDDLAGADTVVVPGIEDPTLPVPDAIVTALRAACANGARRVDLLRHVHPGGGGTARRQAGNHPLVCRRAAGEAVSCSDGGPRRAVR